MNASRLIKTGALLTLIAASILFVWSRPAGRLERVAEFGANPTGLAMHLYVPPRPAARPAVVLALHYCTGNGPDFHSKTGFAKLADQFGFLVIFPSATRPGHCWDVHSAEALRRGGNSDPRGLLSMLDHVVKSHAADRSRVFVTGHSSGAMMTQVLLGAYPDVFQAGASFAGVPFGCFAGPNEWHSDCAQGKVRRSAAEWGELVRAAYPGYQGARPRLQLWHGTEDAALNFHNLGESVKQWTHVLGLASDPVSTEAGMPNRRWVRMQFADSRGMIRLEAFHGQGIPHNFRLDAGLAVRFFGLDPPDAP